MNLHECHKPKRDSRRFITATLKSISSASSLFRSNPKAYSPADAPVMLFISIALIIMTASSKNLYFSFVMLSVLSVRMCLLEGKDIIKAFLPALYAGIFSAIILIPSVFCGSPHSVISISLKTFITTGIIQCLSISSRWNDITASLKMLKISDSIIMSFDLTLKYIQILCSTCEDMLNALIVRSIGKNREKAASLSGISGTAFLKSKKMSEETSQAMECRCFSGHYERKIRLRHKAGNIISIILFSLIAAIFIYLEFRIS